MRDPNYERYKLQGYESEFGGNREKCIQRDGGKCVWCGMTREMHKEVFGRDITVDHIDRWGSNMPKELRNNDLDNLRTLCCSCHSTRTDNYTNHTVGEKHSRAVLTEKQVRYVIASKDTKKPIVLAQELGVHEHTIKAIYSGRSWNHITGLPKQPHRWNEALKARTRAKRAVIDAKIASLKGDK